MQPLNLNNKWYLPSQPENIKPVPWLAPKAIAFLESLLKPEFVVIEHGCGGSTLWFAARVKLVTSFENNPAWQEAVKGENIRVFSSCHNFPTLSNFYDLLLIDGEPVEERREWIKAASAIVKRGGYIVLDNANRPEYAAERQELRKHADLIYTVDSNRPAGFAYLITEFYRLK